MNVVVLLSGGLDSAVCLAQAREEGHVIDTLSFDYGQRHKIEIYLAAELSRHYGANHHEVRVLLSNLLDGALLNGKVPQDRTDEDRKSGISPVFLPGRNVLFLSYGCALAHQLGASEVWIGANAEDQGGFPDCGKHFFDSFERSWWIGTDRRISITTPLLCLDKTAIVRLAMRLKVPLHMTSSCYRPKVESRPVACGRCDACQIRLKAFQANEEMDPIHYASA